MHGLSIVQNKEKDLSSRGEAARCAPRLKGLFCFLKTTQTTENTRFSCPQRVYHAYLLNALKRGFKRPPPTMPIRGLAGVKNKKRNCNPIFTGLQFLPRFCTGLSFESLDFRPVPVFFRDISYQIPWPAYISQLSWKLTLRRSFFLFFLSGYYLFIFIILL